MFLFPTSDNPFTWYARVRNKRSGRERTYYMKGAGVTRETVAEFLATFYRNVQPLTIERCQAQPTRVLGPIPAEDHQFGVLSAMGLAPDPPEPRDDAPLSGSSHARVDARHDHPAGPPGPVPIRPMKIQSLLRRPR